MEAAAVKVLARAVELDGKKRLTEAKLLYQEGIQLLIDYHKTLPEDEKKKAYSNKIGQYLERTEAIKAKIERERKSGTFHEERLIEDNSIGHSYDSVFGRFFDSEVTFIHIEDPYIRIHRQRQNFLRFCELAVKKCPNLKAVELVTSEDQSRDGEARKWFSQFKEELISRHRVDLTINYSSTLHDRKIHLSNGWIIIIGRGLDYFKAPESVNCSLGQYDLDLRPCYETLVNIYHEKILTSRHS